MTRKCKNKAQSLFGKDKTAGQPFCTTYVARRVKCMDALNELPVIVQELNGYLIA
jgi:hypothetical protein